MRNEDTVRAIVWNGAAGPHECEARPALVDDTDALIWAADGRDSDLTGVVVDVGAAVGSFEVGDAVVLPESDGDHRGSSSLWGLTEFFDAQASGHLVRVPLAELNLVSRCRSALD